jgi:hypothetical protein
LPASKSGCCGAVSVFDLIELLRAALDRALGAP